MALGIAIFLSELAPRWIRRPVGFLVELLAAVPSVIYGLWGLCLRPGGRKPLGMSLPTIPRRSCRSSPGPVFGPSRLAAGWSWRSWSCRRSAPSAVMCSGRSRAPSEASLALGATRWETISAVLLPYGLSGILGAIDPGTWSGLGRDDRRDDGHRQQPRHDRIPPAPRLHDGLGHRQRVHRGHVPLYLSALIEIGLVLFVITLIINACRQLLTVAGRRPEAASSVTARWPHRPPSTSRRRRREPVMLGLTATAARRRHPADLDRGLRLIQGSRPLSLEFFTAAHAGRRRRRRHRQRDRRLAITVGLGVLIAAPIGMLAGIYAAARPQPRSGLIRFRPTRSPACRRSSWASSLTRSWSCPRATSRLLWRCRPRLHHAAIMIRTTEEMLKLVPGSLREGSLALGARNGGRTCACFAGRDQRHPDRPDARHRPGRRRGRADALHRLRQSIHEHRLHEPVATLPHTVFVYAIRPMRTGMRRPGRRPSSSSCSCSAQHFGPACWPVAHAPPRPAR